MSTTGVIHIGDHQVEAFLMNPTFSSKGGFRIIINGITIYQVKIHITASPRTVNILTLQKYGPLESEWDSQKLATQMLRKFQAFANKVSTYMLINDFDYVFHVKIEFLEDRNKFLARSQFC